MSARPVSGFGSQFEVALPSTPVTYGLLGGLCLSTVLCLISGALYSFFVLSWGKVLHLQLWRPWTAFTLLSAGGPFIFIALVILLYFGSRSLEVDYFNNHTANYLYFVILSWAVAVVESIVLPPVLYPSGAWAGALVFSVFQLYAHAYGNAPLQYFCNLPTFLGPPLGVLLISLTSGEFAWPAALGLLNGQLFAYLQSSPRVSQSVRDRLSAPQFLVNAVGDGSSAAQSVSGRARGSSNTGFLTGHKWGPGQRLGEGPVAPRQETLAEVVTDYGATAAAAEPPGRPAS
mmetsp:Transcript_33631/g.82516  ORF Transcript_33631/g.82516 Transcript_33631/m.82516 type:complete len:288 (+) Transcript_33631:627-1490(+)